MTYAWTPEMPRVSSDPKLEAHYRAAIIAATSTLETIVNAGDDLPIFAGGRYASPKNPTAVTVAAAVQQAIAGAGDPVPEGAARASILTIAVRSAYLVRANGFGDAGWSALELTLSRTRTPVPVPAPSSGPRVA